MRRWARRILIGLAIIVGAAARHLAAGPVPRPAMAVGTVAAGAEVTDHQPVPRMRCSAERCTAGPGSRILQLWTPGLRRTTSCCGAPGEQRERLPRRAS